MTKYTFTVIWKVKNGDFHEQDFKGYASLQDVATEWFGIYGLKPQDCDELNFILKHDK